MCGETQLSDATAVDCNRSAVLIEKCSGRIRLSGHALKVTIRLVVRLFGFFFDAVSALCGSCVSLCWRCACPKKEFFDRQTCCFLPRWKLKLSFVVVVVFFFFLSFLLLLPLAVLQQVVVMDCSDLVVTLEGRVIGGVVEVIKCVRTELRLQEMLPVLQVDGSRNCAFNFGAKVNLAVACVRVCVRLCVFCVCVLRI